MCYCTPQSSNKDCIWCLWQKGIDEIKDKQKGVVVKKTFLSTLKTWVAWKVAKEELTELTLLKRDINDLKVWCSHNRDVSAAALWLEDKTSYPRQYAGCHGSIEDVRRYLDKLDKEV